MESPIYCFRFRSCDPLTINRGKSTRIEHTLANAIAHFKEISSTIHRINRPLRISRPGQRLDDDPIDAEDLLALAAGVVVIEPHGLCWLCKRESRKENGKEKRRRHSQ